MVLSNIDYLQITMFLLKFLGAFMLSLPIGWEREKSRRDLGLRTFPLVAVASCGYVLLSERIVESNPQAQARIIQGLMTGMGFIGGGAILKDGGTVQGTATAASMWTTGVIGAAVAYGHYEIAVVLSIINLLTLRLLQSVKRYFINDDGTEN